MDTSLLNILKSWKSSIERYGKLDSWRLDESLSKLGKYIHSNIDDKKVSNLVKQIRDMVIIGTYGEVLLNKINNVIDLVEPKNESPICFMVKKKGGRVKKEGQETRFKGTTRHIFEERLKFKDGMLLRNFDIEVENACDSRKVRRIVEKRMCQAYRKRNQRSSAYNSNKDRYWMKRATAFQLYNIGQVEHIRYISRGFSTHWKKMFDPQTGETVFKKKMVYSGKEAALIAIEAWKQAHPYDVREMHAYQCVICKKWHIGHLSLVGEEEIMEQCTTYDSAC